MKIIIAGASGFIGQHFISRFKGKHEFTLLGRDKNKLQRLFKDSYPILTWDELTADSLEGIDAIINLAGENIGASKWTKQQKNKIIESRVHATSTLVKLCLAKKDKAPKLLNASAIGIYGLRKTIEEQNTLCFSEDFSLNHPTNDFISEVGRAWESALIPAESAGINVIKLRFGVVLSYDGGALKKMLPSFKLGLGAIIGSGKQPMSWISLNDTLRAIKFLLETPNINGAYNLVATQVVSQKHFAKTLAKILKRPCYLILPSFLVKLLFGDMGNELLLNGQSVDNSKIKAAGFTFENETLESALK